MAEVDFSIGHKDYRLASQPGEEKLLRRAAALLDSEAQVILEQAGRMPEQRLLLLAGLMLADKFSVLEDRAETAEKALSRLKTNPAKVEVPVIPADLKEAMAELAARAESIAEQVEDRLAD